MAKKNLKLCLGNRESWSKKIETITCKTSNITLHKAQKLGKGM